jgi:hypothetical protein
LSVPYAAWPDVTVRDSFSNNYLTDGNILFTAVVVVVTQVVESIYLSTISADQVILV